MLFLFCLEPLGIMLIGAAVLPRVEVFAISLIVFELFMSLLKLIWLKTQRPANKIFYPPLFIFKP